MKRMIARMLRAAGDRIHPEPGIGAMHYVVTAQAPSRAEIAAYVERLNRVRASENQAIVFRR